MFGPAMFTLAMAPAIFAQKREAQSASSFSVENTNNGQTILITNSAFEMVGPAIPGRPQMGRLVLRKTVKSKAVVDDIGIEATTTVEAWPLGSDLKQKPLYSVTAKGIDPKTVNWDLFTIERGLEEDQWWTVYRLGDGRRLFDTHVPLTVFTVSRADGTGRYAGLEVAADDTRDTRLKDPHAVAVLRYAAPDRVIREAVITSDDTNQAVLLRSFADATRTLEFVEAAWALRISISQNYPSPPGTVTITVPIVRDDLDVAHAQAPMKVHVAALKR